jgi:hypothetical protein
MKKLILSAAIFAAAAHAATCSISECNYLVERGIASPAGGRALAPPSLLIAARRLSLR